VNGRPDNAPLGIPPGLLALAALAILLAGAYLVLRPFLVPILWAAILVYATWPLLQQLRRHLPGHGIATSAIMTASLILLLFGPVVLISLALSAEMATAVAVVREISAQDQSRMLAFVRDIPLMGLAAANRLEALIQDPQVLRESLVSLAQASSGLLKEMAGGAARNAVKLGIALITVFFLYLHGDVIVAQVRRAAVSLGGERVLDYLTPVTQTVNAVLFGLILTALAQGLLAGLAYGAVGLPVPALLGAATALLALIPFGAPLVWGPAGAYLLLQEQWLAGVGLLLWGLLVVSLVDNLVRPVVISATTRIPFLLVFFGVIGGAMAFGLIGLFLGPILLSVLLTLWREWTEATA
jgi:predicted PurR-regulated permease PerM